jgi:anti-sigma regulatory factor (Ser/Thr protein kinase)
MIRVNVLNDKPLIKIDSPSSETHVAGMLHCVKASLQNHGVRDCTDLLIVLRELLMNAIVHGNEGDLERRVAASVSRMEGGRFALEVEDEGKGFDHRRLVMELPADPARLKKKGYVLIHTLAEEILFNDEGNRVKVVLSLPGGG